MWSSALNTSTAGRTLWPPSTSSFLLFYSAPFFLFFLLFLFSYALPPFLPIFLSFLFPSPSPVLSSFCYFIRSFDPHIGLSKVTFNELPNEGFSSSAPSKAMASDTKRIAYFTKNPVTLLYRPGHFDILYPLQATLNERA